jgi:hypothetical protein
MKESIQDLLRRISGILHFFKLYEESKRISLLSSWIQGRDDIPEDI